jgi:ABC-type uncharacterized transport system auxiliary subunit
MKATWIVLAVAAVVVGCGEKSELDTPRVKAPDPISAHGGRKSDAEIEAIRKKEIEKLHKPRMTMPAPLNEPLGAEK